MATLYRVLILTLIALTVSVQMFSIQVHADHKLCEDMNLNQTWNQNYSLNFDSKESLITIKGPFEIGIVVDLRNALETYSKTAGIVLDSVGGNVYQARGIAKLIDNHDLDTYVYGTCYSACTLAFVAGKTRYLGINGKLGFHTYYINPSVKNPILNIEKEQQKDIKFYSQHNIDSAFIEKIFKTKCSGIWEPHLEVLINAGVVHAIIEQ